MVHLSVLQMGCVWIPLVVRIEKNERKMWSLGLWTARIYVALNFACPRRKSTKRSHPPLSYFILCFLSQKSTVLCHILHVLVSCKKKQVSAALKEKVPHWAFADNELLTTDLIITDYV